MCYVVLYFWIRTLHSDTVVVLNFLSTLEVVRFVIGYVNRREVLTNCFIVSDLVLVTVVHVIYVDEI